MRRLPRRAVLLLTPLVLLATACSGAGAPSGAGERGSALRGELTVFAAASLTEAFEALGEQLETEHRDLTVTFNFASSSTLAAQIVEGAPADVFASANATQMDVVTDEGLAASEPATFTGNVLEIVVEAGNPLEVETLEDLTADDVVLVLAAPEVPAGRYASEMLDAEGISVSPASLEVDVRAALAKVAFGEADAAIVYRSDVATAGDEVSSVEIPADRNVSASYPIVPLADSASREAAEAFVELVRAPEGQRALETAGFTSP